MQVVEMQHPKMQAFCFHPGHHYVVYPDGQRSMLMQKRTARGYARIFGGMVVDTTPPSRFSRFLSWLRGSGSVGVFLLLTIGVAQARDYTTRDERGYRTGTIREAPGGGFRTFDDRGRSTGTIRPAPGGGYEMRDERGYRTGTVGRR